VTAELPQVWGPTRPALAAAWVLVAVGAAAAVVGVVAGLVQAVRGDIGALGVGLAYAAMFGLMFGVSGWRFGLRPRITADAEGVRVRNPGQETFLPWHDILDASAGYSGITIKTPNGELTAWAVQKWNLSRWLGRRTRADDVADFIRQHGRNPAP
jgi:hypothetical protein